MMMLRALRWTVRAMPMWRGTTNSSDFPTKNPLYPNLWGPTDAFVTKISDRTTPYLTLGTIPQTVTVNTSFDVTINAWTAEGAVDVGFNGLVSLDCSAGLDKYQITLTNGSWIGTLAVQSEGSYWVIRANGGGGSGMSNPFSTTQAASHVGNVSGLVTDDRSANPMPLPGATVTLQGQAGQFNSTTPTDAQGFYNFLGVPAGSYSLWATYEGRTSPLLLVDIPDGGGNSVNPKVPPLISGEKLPVVLVPGIMGSTRKGAYNPFPRLKTKHLSRNELQIHDPLHKTGWRDLREALENQVRVVDCPWDWRGPVEEATNNLQEAIQEAQGGNPDQMVNVVAHSMGGLIVRQYIQTYPDQAKIPIANVIMLGTPHLGSSNAYYIWEGGDPKTVDDLTADSLIAELTNFYTTTTLYLMNDFFWLPTSPLIYLAEMDQLKTLAPSIRLFMASFVPAVRQLLPTYPFLTDSNSTKTLDTNELLLRLNSNEGVGANRFRMGKPGIPGKVPTRVYYSKSQKRTIYSIPVKKDWSSLLGLWEDGRPYNNRDPSWIEGDGTVPWNSAYLPVDEGWAEGVELTGSHLSLVKTAMQQPDDKSIITYLYPDLAQKALKATAKAAESPVFSLTFNGRLAPYITDPQGRKAGINPGSGIVEYGVPGAKVETDADSGCIAIENPVGGVYTISLKGRAPGAYHLTFDYVAMGQSPISQDLEGYLGTETINFTVTLDPGVITINSPATAPTNLIANAASQNGQLMTSLTWTASTDPNVTSYKIYARGVNESSFTLLGTTSGTTYLTNDLWAADGSITPKVYALVAVKQNGTESFFSTMALNNDRDHDGLSDVDELKYGTNPDKVDTDGDGVNDGAELNGGSDPLDPKSRPTTWGKGLPAILQLLLID